jgi:hypothetical protein
MRKTLAVFLILFCLASPAHAQDRWKAFDDFMHWLVEDIKAIFKPHVEGRKTLREAFQEFRQDLAT